MFTLQWYSEATMDELWNNTLQAGEQSGELPLILNNKVHYDGNSELPTRVPITASVISTPENRSNINSSINSQDIIIADISYSTAQTFLDTSLENTTAISLSPKQLKEINLRSLLTEWNLASLTEELICKLFLPCY